MEGDFLAKGKLAIYILKVYFLKVIANDVKKSVVAKYSEIITDLWCGFDIGFYRGHWHELNRKHL